MRQDKAQGGTGYRKFEIRDRAGNVLAHLEMNWHRVKARVPGGKWGDSYLPDVRKYLLEGRLHVAAQYLFGLCIVATWPDAIFMEELK